MPVPVVRELSVKTKADEVVVPETLAEVKVWAEVVVVTPKVEEVERAMAPALELPILTAPIEVPVLMLVAKLEEALRLTAAPVEVTPVVVVKPAVETLKVEPALMK